MNEKQIKDINILRFNFCKFLFFTERPKYCIAMEYYDKNTQQCTQNDHLLPTTWHYDSFQFHKSQHKKTNSTYIHHTTFHSTKTCKSTSILLFYYHGNTHFYRMDYTPNNLQIKPWYILFTHTNTYYSWATLSLYSRRDRSSVLYFHWNNSIDLGSS
jgi:hypothetical protein